MASSSSSKEFPLVGVGASAGGLESFKRFIDTIPEKSGMAYILVQHLSPSHESMLPKILALKSKIPVEEITDNHQLKPDHIYVIPPNKMLEVTDHHLKLTQRLEGVQNMPIDLFFSSLGKIHGKLATGVVLSGTARDGTFGLRCIREHGGLTFAEDPESAVWEGMPKSAIDAGVVDFVMRPEEMPKKLLHLNKGYQTKNGDQGGANEKVKEDGLKKIISLVRQRSDVDFSAYKSPTLIRRINRRMAINSIDLHEDYLEYLKENPSEQESLFQDLLIKYTSFFRDPEVFQELKATIFPDILQGRSDKNPIRIWVAGCATGEEVYSLAISLFEALNESLAEHTARIQIFASDVSETALAKARSGTYSESELQPLTEEQINHYFTRTDGSYSVIKAIRDSIVFSVHNILKDPPFGNLDLISCRNLFIYLEPYFQKKALTTFHYALKENGYLVLGKSESAGKHSDLFSLHSEAGMIHRRRPGEGRFIASGAALKPANITHVAKKEASPVESRPDFKKSAERILVSDYTPASVIVDGHYEIVHYSGKTEPFLVPSQGRPTHELMKTARKELAFELRNALEKAKNSSGKIKKKSIPVTTDRENFSVDIEIVPLIDLPDPHYLILFWKKSSETSIFEKVRTKLEPVFSSTAKARLEQRNSALELEVGQLREDMRVISEGQEAYNEELQSSNEELLSTNEEMQSLNEELETSKEELQSTNEELIVVNRELIEKQGDLNEEMQYSDDLIASINEPFLVLHENFLIRQANASYAKKFNIAEKEIEGKHFYEIHNGQWKTEPLLSLLENVLPKKQNIVDQEITIDVHNGREHVFNFNAREVLREKQSKKLILIEMAEVTETKSIERDYIETIEELNRKNQQLDQFVHVASHDLQEPLRKISTFVSLITAKKNNLSEEQKEIYLNKIKSASERMSSLLKNMLNYARLENHEQLYERTDLNVVLEQVLEDFELIIEQKEVEMRVGDLPVIEALPLQINQLFYNLISNALKFSRKGVPPIVSITSRRISAEETKKNPSLDPELSYYEVVVRDNGIGFGPKYRKQIFTIFQRLHPSSQYLGTGIGLALCKKIATTHHGEIFADSEEGEGSAFYILLPHKQPV